MILSTSSSSVSIILLNWNPLWSHLSAIHLGPLSRNSFDNSSPRNFPTYPRFLKLSNIGFSSVRGSISSFIGCAVKRKKYYTTNFFYYIKVIFYIIVVSPVELKFPHGNSTVKNDHHKWLSRLNIKNIAIYLPNISAKYNQTLGMSSTRSSTRSNISMNLKKIIVISFIETNLYLKFLYWNF